MICTAPRNINVRRVLLFPLVAMVFVEGFSEVPLSIFSSIDGAFPLFLLVMWAPLGGNKQLIQPEMIYRKSTLKRSTNTEDNQTIIDCGRPHRANRARIDPDPISIRIRHYCRRITLKSGQPLWGRGQARGLVRVGARIFTVWREGEG